MDKRYKSKSLKESIGIGADSVGNEIMMTNMFRELNDSTSSSSTVVHGNYQFNAANRYSSTGTDRTSVLNYLLEN